jgi:hypothetical protein
VRAEQSASCGSDCRAPLRYTRNDRKGRHVDRIAALRFATLAMTERVVMWIGLPRSATLRSQ